MADLDPNPYFAPLCGDILMSSACQQINFYWAGQHIDGSGFCYIALALTSGGIKVLEGTMPVNVGAFYSPDKNTITIPSSFDFSVDSNKMSIVHESTHAIQDAEIKGQLRGVDAEAAAFVAGALYIIYSGSSYSPTPGGTHPAFAIAQGIAQSISGNPGYAIDPTTMAPLRTAILGDPTYQFLSAHPNYTEDGVSL